MNSPNRIHNRESFFKYLSADAAINVLTNSSLRWSSPILFNDPFDVPRELTLNIESKDIIPELLNRFSELIFNPPNEFGEFTDDIQKLITIFKTVDSQEEKVSIFLSLKEKASLLDPGNKSLESFREHWRNQLPNLRILCLTDSPKHAAMWFHYAAKYSGIVLELHCSDKLDSAWLQAKPVEYPTAKPAIYTIEGWSKLLMLQTEVAVEKIVDLSTFKKSPDWSYENEWRLRSTKRPYENGLYSDYKFHPEELKTIYLGPKINAAHRDTIISLSKNYNAVEIIDVAFGIDREFKFKNINS